MGIASGQSFTSLKKSSMNLDPMIDFLLERGVMYPPSVVAHVSPKSLSVCAGQESNTQ